MVSGAHKTCLCLYVCLSACSQRVLKDLVSEKLPSLSSHFTTHQCELSLFTTVLMSVCLSVFVCLCVCLSVCFQRVLKDLVSEKLPSLSSHFTTHQCELSLFTFNWFLVLLVDSLPVNTFLRVWDSFLYEGSKVTQSLTRSVTYLITNSFSLYSLKAIT